MAYNGYKNWNHWNVSLWINNDEGLYNFACEFVSMFKTKDRAARNILNALKAGGKHKTPDGAPYTLSSVRAALVGM